MKLRDFVVNVSEIYRESKRRENPIMNHSDHIKCAIDWLSFAQDVTSDGGVSHGYHLYHGWLSPYPETTGYIIDTFFDHFYCTGDEGIKARAIRMGEWLMSIQNPDGSIYDSHFRRKMVFDTGQVIFGFVRCYKETGIEGYKLAAVKAGDWLLGVQDPDGAWRQYSVQGIPHSYYARVGWSLLALHGITGDERYVAACCKNIEWAIRQQGDNGWFNHASFKLKDHIKPFTHTVAYTIRGILEASIYLKRNDYFHAAVKAVNKIIKTVPDSGFVPGTYDKNWLGERRFSCLTGNAQLAIIFFITSQKLNSKTHFDVACRINEFLKSNQNTATNNSNIRGGIPGSYPIWGKYMHFTYPNWAAKFFIDSLILEQSIREEKNW